MFVRLTEKVTNGTRSVYVNMNNVNSYTKSNNSTILYFSTNSGQGPSSLYVTETPDQIMMLINASK